MRKEEDGVDCSQVLKTLFLTLPRYLPAEALFLPKILH